jgi:hypothetical protein
VDGVDPDIGMQAKIHTRVLAAILLQSRMLGDVLVSHIVRRESVVTMNPSFEGKKFSKRQIFEVHKA